MSPPAIPFTKMHGCRNDYVVVDAERAGASDPATLASVICDRRSGVGADGLLIVSSSARADFRMRMFNVDGSEAEMCGNGLRCAAAFAVDIGICEPTDALRAETGAGVLSVWIDRGASRVTVDMGAPALEQGGATPSIEIDGVTVPFTPVELGNPHAVLFVESVDSAPVTSWGPIIETHERFPNRTNVEFVEVVNDHEVRQRTWERGCGETPACGTGACAVVVAGVLTARTARAVRVHLVGGELDVEWTTEGSVRQTGPVVRVFEGRWPGGA